MIEKHCPFGNEGDKRCSRDSVYKQCLRPQPYAYWGLKSDKSLHGDYRDDGCPKFMALLPSFVEEHGYDGLLLEEIF